MADLQEIYVLNKRLKLLHTAPGFKTSIDSVLLASACPAKAGDHIVDLGCGVGGAGLSVLARINGVMLTGIETQADHVDLARENAVANAFQDQCDFVHSDVRDYKNDNAFHHVICNPPYLEAGHHLRSPSKENAIAMGGLLKSLCPQAGGRGDKQDDLKMWIDCAYDCLKSNGSMTMIHRADKVDKIILAIGKRFGAVEIIPLWPKAGEPAKRVIIRAIKHRKSPAHIHAGLILHHDNGKYSDEAEQILRHAEPLL